MRETQDERLRRALSSDAVSAAAAAPYVAANDDLARRIAQLLHNQPNPVRQPTWLEPPWLAHNLRHSINAGIAAGAAAETWGICWTPQPDTSAAGTPLANAHVVQADTLPGGEPEQFPVGQVGAVKVRCSAYLAVPPVASAHVIRQARWSLIHNGQVVQGYARQLPGGIHHQAEFTANDLTTGLPEGGASIECETAAPILLRERDTLQVVLNAVDVTAGTVFFAVQMHGWAFAAVDGGPYFGAFFKD